MQDHEGKFVLIEGVDGVYIYHHGKSAHAACSNVTAAQLADFAVSFHVTERTMLNCEEDDHFCLEPYLKCNKYVLDMYQKFKSRCSIRGNLIK